MSSYDKFPKKINRKNAKRQCDVSAGNRTRAQHTAAFWQALIVPLNHRYCITYHLKYKNILQMILGLNVPRSSIIAVLN